MTEPTRIRPDDSTDAAPARSRRRAAALALLLGVTLAAGAALRVAARTDDAPAGRSGGPGVTLATASDGLLDLEARLDRTSVLAGGDGLVRVELVLRAHGVATERARVPTDLVVVLDRSGSMQGGALASAQAAVRELVAGLAPGDRFALVSYASNVRVDVPLEAAGPAARERWLARVSGLRANGGTHMASGLDRAHALLAHATRAGRAPRVILLSDGHANQGDHSLDGLRGRAHRAVEAEYVLSAVGLGHGFDEALMSALADAGTGNFYYLPDPGRASRLTGVFADEFAAARESVARAVSVHLAPQPGVRVASAAGYPLSHEAGGVRFHPGDLFAGQERRIWLTLHAPTHRAGDVGLGRVRVEFRSAAGEPHRVALGALPAVACVTSDADYYGSFAPDAYLRANLQDSLGALKQRIARAIADGDRYEALSELETYEARSRVEQLRALGYVSKDEARELDDLRATVSAPEMAEPEARNRAGKALLEAGRDAQRAGSKY